MCCWPGLDDASRDKHREKLEEVRRRQQEEYAREVERERERQERLAEQRRSQKLGLQPDGAQDGGQPEQAQRFDALEFVRTTILEKPVVIFSKSWCPYSR